MVCMHVIFLSRPCRKGCIRMLEEFATGWMQGNIGKWWGHKCWDGSECRVHREHKPGPPEAAEESWRASRKRKNLTCVLNQGEGWRWWWSSEDKNSERGFLNRVQRQEDDWGQDMFRHLQVSQYIWTLIWEDSKRLGFVSICLVMAALNSSPWLRGLLFAIH